MNDIFYCNLHIIFESLQGTSKIPTLIYIIKTNALFHLKMLTCNFNFLKNLTDFRNIILQPVGKFNSKFLKHFFTASISFLPNPICLVLSFIFRFVYILGIYRLQKEDWQNKLHLAFSSHRRCFVRKNGLKNFAKFIGKNLCQSLF